MEKFITTNAEQTRKMGEMLAKELKSGKIICLEGELGSGKTTFAQGILKGLKVKGPYTSPTFVIMKHYKKEVGSKKQVASVKIPLNPPLKKGEKKQANEAKKPMKLSSIYHIDAYRVGAKDILELSWEEIVKNKNNAIIIEWADRIKKIIPNSAIWIKFKWMEKNKRAISLKS
jgi:tRNA threonylcarbamoyladenosine biosynthesis protein TsaE